MNLLLKINLQLFANEEKTEKATPKKRQDTRNKGQVYQSRELTASIVLLSIIMGLKIFGSYMYSQIELFFARVFQEYIIKSINFTVPEVIGIVMEFIMLFLKILMPLFAIVILAAVSIQLAQVGFLFTTETLGLKLEKLNPLTGFKRMFSLNSIVELVKALLKIGIIGLIGYLYIKREVVTIISMMDMDVVSAAITIMDIVISVAIRMAFTMLIIGIFDLMYQWWKYEKDMKMTKKEIKDEFKQQEGNPEVKAKIKQKQRQISLRRMMQEIPKADVVITNPTHFAVAVKYDPKKSEAPYVLAKGQDYLALRIRELAKQNKVEVVENKPLARALYQSVDVGKAIPQDLYQAVAEVLAFVYSLKGKTSAS
jgi:flagellar biosynthetic protein FlhB